MSIRIGSSGWTYAGWRRVFYPKGLVQRRELEYASQRFGSIEINGTFYSLQRPESYAQWYDATPRDFRFAVKGSRFITHMKQLRDVDTAVANFFASGVLRLEEKLGPILWQFPARVGRRAARRSRRDVYVYFDNDRKVRAPFDALRLIERVQARRGKRAA